MVLALLGWINPLVPAVAPGISPTDLGAAPGPSSQKPGPGWRARKCCRFSGLRSQTPGGEPRSP